MVLTRQRGTKLNISVEAVRRFLIIGFIRFVRQTGKDLAGGESIEKMGI